MPRVAIIGTGLIGASIGLGLKANAAGNIEIIGSDRYRDHARDRKSTRLNSSHRT